ncbi:MAG: FAD-dependent oxidoreductase [Bacilli bacterium]|nr:FAD-dependent oxidoreductase [Bacilli bacterium]
MIYDYIVIGSGLGGLSAGLNLAEKKKKVLMLEKNTLPGGLTTTFKRGRFEFDTMTDDLYNYGDGEHVGDLQNVFRKFGIDIDARVIPFNTRIKVLASKEDYEVKGKFEEFILLLEEMNEGSVEPIKEFFKVIKEVHDALKEVENGNTNLAEVYPNFYKYLDVNAIKAMEDMKLPKNTIHRLSYFWVEMGSPLNKLSFIDFAEFMYKLVFKKSVVLNNKSLDLMIKLVKKYQNKGGKLFYNSNVVEIRNEEGLKIVVTSDGIEYEAKHVVCNVSKRYVLKHLMKDGLKEANRIENARTVAPAGITVYLGLNADYRTIGLNNHRYFEFDNLNSEINIKSMQKLEHDTFRVVVPNVVNENVSPQGTTIMILKTDYYADVLKDVTEDKKLDLAQNLIQKFEEAFDIQITPYIEEVYVATSYDVMEYANSNGGYMRLGYDNSINRLLADDEEQIPGLSFVGAASIFGGGFDNAFYSGLYVTNKLLSKEEGN